MDPTGIAVSFSRDYGFNDSEAEQLEEESLWNKAREVGAIGVQKQLLKTKILEMVVVPLEGQSEEDARKELLAEIDQLQRPSAAAGSRLSNLGTTLFGGGSNEPGGSAPVA